MDRDIKKRMEHLKWVNKIKQFIKEINIVNNLSENNVLPEEKSTYLLNKIVDKLEDENTNNRYEKLTENYEKWLYKSIANNFNMENEYVIYLSYKGDVFATKILLKTILCNKEKLLEYTSIRNGGSYLIIVDENACSGVCIWKSEYYIRGYCWKRQNV